MGSMEGSCTGGTKRLGTFDKPPIIIFEWDDLTYTWFYRPHPTRHLAESLVGAGVPVVIVQRPQHGGEKGDLRELEQVQFGIWCCSPWYPELEVVHDQLQGVEQRFPESPWVFRHPNWLPLVRTYDCSRRMVVYDSRSMVAGDGTSAEIGLRARHFGAIADLVVTDSVAGLIRWARLNERTCCLRMGSVVTGTAHPKLPSAQLEQVPHPRLLVFNDFAEALDTELLIFVAQQRPDWSVLIFGRRPSDSAAWTRYPNIHYFGERLYFERPACMQNGDVGLVPLKMNAETRVLTPMVAREYRAAGLPVVATFVPDLLVGDDPQLRVACDYWTFLEAIQTALSGDDQASRAIPAAKYLGGWGQDMQDFVRIVFQDQFQVWKEACYEPLVAGYYEALRTSAPKDRPNIFLHEEVAEAAYANRLYEIVLEWADPGAPSYGSALVRVGEVARAREWLKQFLSSNRSDDEALVDRFDPPSLGAYIFQLHGETAEALRILGNAEIGDPVYRLLAARLWFDLGFSDQAVFSYAGLLHEHVDLLKAGDYINIGDLMLEHARFTDAEQAYLQAALLGGAARAQERLAHLYQRRELSE